MLTRTSIVWANITIAVLVASLVMLGTAAGQRQAVPKLQDKLVLGENEVKQLLLLMDTDQSGKISKQEWMKFMEAEFDRLDKDKKGQLDVKELTQSKLRASHPVSVGK
jgi:Ca2+-binding EF-hand superfamily protein